ncbi:MAG: energy transducer TonB [Cyclobacteriaceae bacterium]|nr:energy transducer TonB [Cyclobacteriaceae bacterium]
MKHLLILATFFFISTFSAAQDYELTPEQIAANKRFHKAKLDYLDKKYKEVLDYYDSLLRENNTTRLETYKMASESCRELANINKKDSIYYINRSNNIYNKAVQWNGKMMIKERWNSIEIDPSDDPEVFKIVDTQPQYPGGFSAFYKYVMHEMKYPAEARRKGIEGKIYVQFVVNKDGSVDGVNVINRIGGGCDEEAIRVVKNSSRFTPGLQEGKPVYVRMVLPLTFKLSNPPKKKKKG